VTIWENKNSDQLQIRLQGIRRNCVEEEVLTHEQEVCGGCGYHLNKSDDQTLLSRERRISGVLTSIEANTFQSLRAKFRPSSLDSFRDDSSVEVVVSRKSRRR